MGIIGVSGRMQSGKDTVGKIIQYLTGESTVYPFDLNVDYSHKSNWEVKKFADKLKDIVCTILNCTREQLEDRKFKETPLGEEWVKFKVVRTKITKFERIDEVFYFSTIEEANKFKLNNLNYDYFGEIEKVEMTPRLMLQLLGTECGRNIIHPDIWVNSLMAEYKSKLSSNNPVDDLDWEPRFIYPNWIITDTRFENELKAVKDREGITIRVNRIIFREQTTEIGKIFTVVQPEVDKLLGIQEHSSETALDNADFDYVIDNNGTISELIDKIRNILIENKLIKNK